MIERATRISGHAKGRLEQRAALAGRAAAAPRVRSKHAGCRRARRRIVRLRSDGAGGCRCEDAAASRMCASSRRSRTSVSRSFRICRRSIPCAARWPSKAGKLQRSTLSAKWLGGPVTLRVSERRERRATASRCRPRVWSNAKQLVALSAFGWAETSRVRRRGLANSRTFPRAAIRSARWQGRADANLSGVSSNLPQPLQKATGTAMPLHIEANGSGDEGVLRLAASDRVRTIFALRRVSGADWRVERGGVRLGGGNASLPEDSVVRVEGQA